MKTTTPEARSFALEAHGDQMYGEHPYGYHLDNVADIAFPFGILAQVIAYLHDVGEDTPVTIDTIKAEFGDFVGQCVAYLSDETGKNRKERKRLTNIKLANITAEYDIALIVKAADRLANVRESVKNKSDSKLDMYQNEHFEFRKAAYRPKICDSIWRELDNLLAFTEEQLAYRCPTCTAKGRWRNGVGFEHQMICMACNVVWEPDNKLAESKQRELNQIGMNGDGI